MRQEGREPHQSNLSDMCDPFVYGATPEFVGLPRPELRVRHESEAVNDRKTCLPGIAGG